MDNNTSNIPMSPLERQSQQGETYIAPNRNHPNHKRMLLGFFISVFIVVGLIATLILVRQQQELRQKASGPVCPVDGANCSWDTTPNATSYHYKVVNVDTGNTVKDGDTSDTSIQFTSEPGQTYTCVVTASNVCGVGSQGEGTATCPIISTTPTIPQTPTPTLSLTPTPTPVSCKSVCQTDNDCSSFPGGVSLTCISGQCRNAVCSSDNTCFCGSPTPTPTLTPTLTLTPTVTLTDTPTQTVTPISNTPTPQPTVVVTTVVTVLITPTNGPTQIPGNTATPTSSPTVIIYNATATPTSVLSPSVTTPITGPGDKFINIGVIGVEAFLVGALIIFAL